MDSQIIYKEEAFKIIGCCLEVHKELGKGFNEVIYKDALEIEFQIKDIEYKREKEYDIAYKGHILPRKYYADFVLMDKIILEIKAIEMLTDSNIKQI
jgi:GxxExxY protein